MYFLNGTEYKTKDDVKRNIQLKIKQVGLAVIDSTHSDFSFFNSLFLGHENYETKRGCGVKRFHLRPNPMNFNERTLYVERIDGSEDTWSYKACIGIKKNDLTEAMRNSIKPFTQEFKKNSSLICCECGIKNLNFIEYHTDHKTVPFSKIKNDFLTTNKPPTKFAKNKIYNNMEFCIDDVKYKETWIEYHNSIADYQILCKDCNLKKSNQLIYTNAPNT